LRGHLNYWTTSILNTYAILFFSQNKILGVILLLVSFFNPFAGAAGLAAVLIALIYTTFAGYAPRDIREGLYSFNSLLFGIGMGTFYHFNIAFAIWLMFGCLLCSFINLLFCKWSGKYKLPFLSLPFIITFWILFSAANGIFNMQLQQRFSIILNELSASQAILQPAAIKALAAVSFPYYADLFFRSLSAILFQNNAVAGLLISIGLLIHSRIAFSVLVISFISAILFNGLTHTFPDGISYYHLGSNIMLPAMAIGSFYLIPSFRSYIWGILLIPLTFLLIIAATRILGVFDLPVISLPFFMITVLLLTVLRSNHQANTVLLTPMQYYSPEYNLYQYRNGLNRPEGRFFNIKLPFMGKWLVSQGYYGNITHKDQWGQALDFVITDEEDKTAKSPATLPEHFYCYNKPVLACADGIVESLTDHIEDNPIGQVNTRDNWGNSIVIRHAAGLYSKVSHLKQNSIKVRVGDFVKQGDVIALCGNSGRSPEPHLHFQLQATPYIGSKTVSYPISYYLTGANVNTQLQSYSIPQQGEEISSVATNTLLRRAFLFQPGYTARLTTASGHSETLEVQTDQFNQTYFYSKETEAVAYFNINDTSLSFLSFEGSKRSLLYFFYLAAYKVIFIDQLKVQDTYPLQLLANKGTQWLQDLVAPFYQYVKLDYESRSFQEGEGIRISSRQTKKAYGKTSALMSATIQINQGGIVNFRINLNGQQTEAKWVTESTY